MLSERILDRLTGELVEAFESASSYADTEEYVKSEWCEQIVRDCYDNKSNLIRVLSKHPNWDEENLRVHFDHNYKRVANSSAALRSLYASLTIISDYCRGNIDLAIRAGEDDKALRYATLQGISVVIKAIDTRFSSLEGVTEDTVDYIKNFEYLYNGKYKKLFGDAHIHEGAKVTRAVLKLLRQYGYEELLDDDTKHSFMQYYSQYTDNMNPLEITRHTVLSVNPVDFIYMSNGNSWTSCHNIKEGGCYCGGCESYAYDGDTMIFYTVDSNTPNEEITTARKINRQLNFFNGDTLVACRVYPTCDGSDVYDECKAIVQKIIADCMGKPNMWRESAWGHASFGRQYRDYVYQGTYKGYRLSDILDHERESWHDFDTKENDDTGKLTIQRSNLIIGSYDAICPICGELLDGEEYPFCYSCVGGSDKHCCSCGERIRNEDDVCWGLDDEPYCCSCHSDIFTRCELCDEWEWERETVEYYDSRGNLCYACRSCSEDELYRCDRCFDYYSSVDSVYITDDGECYCEDCWDEVTTECCVCGGRWLTDDGCLAYDEDGREEFVCYGCATGGHVVTCPCCDKSIFVK